MVPMQIITVDSTHSAVLRQPATPVSLPLHIDTIAEIETMRAFYKTFSDKAGFAAPQVGISKKIILIENSLFNDIPSDEPVILINPVWEPINNEKALDFEGCLSVPGKIGFVERYLNVALSAWLYSFETKTVSEIQHDYSAEFSSVLWQHEIDHLCGTVYTDKAKLVITIEEFAMMQDYFIQKGALHPDMTLFDMGPLFYRLAQEYQQSNTNDLYAFLSGQ